LDLSLGQECEDSIKLVDVLWCQHCAVIEGLLGHCPQMEDYDGSREVYLRKVVDDEEYVGAFSDLGSSPPSPTHFSTQRCLT
jgi:hypothetical protein